MNKIITRAALLVAAFIVSIPLGLMAQDEGFYPYSFARLSYVNGDVYVQRTSDLGYEKGEVNLALVQGDKMGTENGQAEIHFGRRNYLRLDNNTKVEFAVLPTEGDERIRIHLTEGSVFFRVSQLALDKGVEIHTPDASFYVLEEGLYRFDVRLEGETQASVREGSLEAASEDGSVLVRYQETVTASDGRLLVDPQYAYVRDDAFDGWNDSRDTQLSARSERQYLPSEMTEYEEELDQNGTWVYERPYGNVWVPNVSVYDAWRPYSYGRWVWYPVIGWTWVSSEPWGWAVYHYGRWNWRFGLGWYWIPRHHWGPAWVHWWSDRAYVGWCPLTWYNRPAYLFNNSFYDRHDDRWFSARNRAWTVVRRDHLQSPDIGRRHLGGADLDRIGRVELRPQQPAIRPAVDNAGPQAVAARRVLADRAGGRSQVRTVAPSRSLASPRSGQSGASPAIRPRGTDASRPRAGSGVVSRPAIRNDGSDNRAIRAYPSQRVPDSRGQSGSLENRRSVAVSPGRGAGSGAGAARVVTRSQERPAGSSANRPATVRETPGAPGTGNASGSSVTRRGESVKNFPSTVRSNDGVTGRPATSSARSIKSTSDRSANTSSGRLQNRTYAPGSSVTRPTTPRVSAPATSTYRSSASISRPAASAARPISSRTPSSSRSSVSSSSRAPSASTSSPRPSVVRPSSSSAPRSSLSAPSRTSRSVGRSYAAPRSSSSSSSRAISAPRSSRSSSTARSSSSVRSGGSSSARSSSAGRAKSASSKSSSSSSRSGGAKKK